MAGFDFAAFRDQQKAQNDDALEETGAVEAIAAAESAIADSKSKSKSAKAPPKAKRASTKRERADSSASAEPPATRRRSTRTATIASGVSSVEERRRLQEEAEAAKEAEEKAEKARIKREKHGQRTIEAQEGATTGAGETESLKELLDQMARFEVTEEKGAPIWEKGKRPKADKKKLKEVTEPLDLRAIVKIIPDRIYSLCAHPDPQRDLVFAGDKTGHLSLWDCTRAGMEKSLPEEEQKIRDGVVQNGDEDEEDEREWDWGQWWTWQGHMQNAVSSIKFRPNEYKQVYSSSYDNTIRSHHFERGISEEVIDGDLYEDDGLIHSFDFDPTGNEVWASDNDGGLLFRDLRAPMDTVKRWNLDKWKIGCVTINPANPGLAATAHLKRYMRLWDLSTLRGLSEDADLDTVLDKALLAEYSYEKACSSAYFDATGTRLATTSYDDTIRIWDVDPKKTKAKDYPAGDNKWKPSKTILHNCQVGRYVTVLRAHWCTAPAYPPHLFVGDMAHTVDLYSVDPAPAGQGEKLDRSGPAKVFTDETLTAAPAVTASHPTVEGKYYGGAASGKVSFWTHRLPEDE
ncbi:hypothetical protein JCM8097_005887 [Rhodosporidiobolus ruineniae]